MKINILIILFCFVFYACSQGSLSKDNSKPLSDTLTIQTDISLREKPDESSSEIMKLKQFDKLRVEEIGEKAVLNGKEDFWYKLTTGDGKAGWVFGFNTSLKKDGQKEAILQFQDFVQGDLYHIIFSKSYNDSESSIDFGSGDNNLNGYQLDVEDADGYLTGNPMYLGKKFKIIYNDLMARTYCNAPEDYEVCIEPTPTIIKLEIID